ncbi:MAG: hypothetical protein MZV63_63020 [Marinilabiliales bacterium]|nr:hypothetical protein [Marinilabiliales bacterium]
MTLSGIVAYKQGRLDDAERDLREALDLAHHQRRRRRLPSRAGSTPTARTGWTRPSTSPARPWRWRRGSRALEKKIGEIEASEMAARSGATAWSSSKRVQVLARPRRPRPRAQYNGAAGYHNAGTPERALDLARLAGRPSAFADKAAELIKIILETTVQATAPLRRAEKSCIISRSARRERHVQQMPRPP